MHFDAAAGTCLKGGVDFIDPGIREHLVNGRKINALRLRREQTGEGLREAKDWIEMVAIPKLKKEGAIPNDQQV